MSASIKEIFESIQGEGEFAGYKQIFVRFTGCNLNCEYCDTDCTKDESSMTLSAEELFDKIKKFDSESISLTGGEPLLQAEFIKSFLSGYKKFLKKEIFLETNGVLYEELEKVINFIDVIAADIKLESATGQPNRFDDNDKFLETASKTACFVKVVFNSNIKEDEIEAVLNLAQKYNLPVILQPKMPLDNAPYLEIYNKFYSKYKDVRLILQMHKFLEIQ